MIVTPAQHRSRLVELHLHEQMVGAHHRVLLERHRGSSTGGGHIWQG
jgi:hypothetical protein